VRPDDDAIRALRAALEQLPAGEVAELIEEARRDARAHVQGLLGELFAEAMLREVRAELERDPAAAPEPAPATSEPAAPEPAPATSEPAPATQVPPQAAPLEAPAWYVYGVVGEEEIALEGLPAGIYGQAPVEMIREGTLGAVTTTVPAEDFGEQQLRAHLADMEWVERVARGHERVLDELQRLGTVIPMRMCTVYRSEEGVREMLRREASAFGDALAHLTGRSEWGVKVFSEPSKSRPTKAAAGAAEAANAGAAYLEQRRRERDAAEQAAQLLERSAAEIHDALCAIAADGLTTAPQRPDVSGRQAEMVLNGVYLIDDESLDAFHGRVEELGVRFAAQGLALELTGPWPAYNFVPGTIGAAW
jgi:predicted RNA-binding protein YlxR (DUF448 family)